MDAIDETDDMDEVSQKGPPFYDAYVLLSGGTEDDIDGIVRRRPAIRPGYVLEDPKYQAFIPLSADDWDHLDRRIKRIIGNRHVEADVLKVPPGLRQCPIKRSRLKPDECLAFGLVNVGTKVDADIDKALQDIRALGVGPAEHVDGEVPILVEVQTAPDKLEEALARIRGVDNVSAYIVYGHLIDVTDPRCPG